MQVTALTVEAVGEEIANAYAAVIALVESEARMNFELLTVQTRLEIKRASLLRAYDPKELGSNEAQRTARLAQMLATEISDVQGWEAAKLGLRAQTETARLRLELARANLRLLEIKAAA